MSEDWMRPIAKPLPGPVESEDRQLTLEERAQIAAIAPPSRLLPGGRPLEGETGAEHLSNGRGDHART